MKNLNHADHRAFTVFFVLLFLLAGTNRIYALDYYWVNGSGNWSNHNSHWATTSGGAVFHDQVPTSMDNVHFDENSGFAPGNNTVTIDQTVIYCMDMDWTGVTGSPTLTAPSDKEVWIYGSLTLSAGMTWNVQGNVRFRAFQAGKTITTAGKSFSSTVYFDGAGGDWIFLDEFSANQTLILISGTIYTNDQTVTVRHLSVECNYNNQPPGLYLGASTVHVLGYGFYVCDTYANTVFDAGTSTIILYGQYGNVNGCGHTFNNVIFKGDNGQLQCGQQTFNAVIFEKNGMIGGSNTFQSLTFTPGYIYTLNGNQVIANGGQLNASGTDCSNFVTIRAQDANQQAGFVHAAGNIDLEFVILQSIVGSGGAVFNADNSVDLGNNTGWTITPVTSRTLYWVGGSGDWNDPAHWSLSSGGSGGQCVPTPYDDIFFDAGSGLGAGSFIDADNAISYCRDMTWTGISGNPQFRTSSNNNKLYIFGSLSLAPAMDYAYNGEVYFMGNSTGKTILLAGHAFPNVVFFIGEGSDWTMLDEFSTNQTLILISGTIYTNDQTVTVRHLSVECNYNNQPPGLYLGASTVHVLGYGFYVCDTYANTVFDAGTSTIILYGQYGNVNGCGHTFNNVIFKGDNGQLQCGQQTFNAVIFEKNGMIGGSNTFQSLTFTPGYIYTLNGNQVIANGGQLNASGTDCSNFVTIRAQDANQQAGFVHAAGNIDLEFVILQSIVGSGGAVFNADNSVDLGNNTGWTITPVTSRTLYWVGGSGDWNDPAHWSLSSGGSGGQCVPTPYDDIFFDAGSGLGAGSFIDADNAISYCRDMTWTGISGNPQFRTSSNNNKLYIFGSLSLAPAMDYAYNGEVYFMGNSTGKTILLAGHAFPNVVFFIGEGSDWTMLDEFSTNQTLILISGTIYTNDQTVTVRHLSVECNYNNQPPGLYLGASTVHVLGYGFYVCDTYANTVFDAGTSTIILYGQYGNVNGCGHTFNNVIFKGDNGQLQCGQQTFNAVIFEKNGMIGGSNTFQSLTFAPGHTYILTSNTTQTIAPLGNFIAEGYGGFPIEIKSTTLGQQATLHKDGDPICLDFLYLTDMAASGSGFSYAGANSDDVFNNSGWIFGACPACFAASPAPAPVLDPASITQTVSGGQVSLILENLPPGQEAVWLNMDQSLELYADVANHFQPTLSESTIFYAILRDLATGCVSEALPVQLCAPPVLASSNSPLCGTATALQLSESGGTAVSWDWIGPGGFHSTDQNPQRPSPVPAMSGQYLVVVTDGFGCTTEDSTYVTIFEPLPISCPADISVCLSDIPLDLSALGASPGGGIFSGNEVFGNNYSASAGTTNTVTYTTTDVNNCSNACTFQITVNEPPQVSCPANQVLCPAELPLDLSALAATPGGGTFSGTGVLGNNYNAPAESINTVTYTVSDANNCAGSCTFDIQVKDGPVCSITNDMDMACPLTTNNHYQAPAGMDSYAWVVNGNGTPTTPLDGSAIEVTAGASGSYTVALTVYKNGCSATCSKMIHIDMSDMKITGADYCPTEDNPMIGLSGSDMGVTYQLQTGNGQNLGQPVIGTGNPIYFGMYPNGAYQVVVSANYCTQTVTGTVNAKQGVCAVSAPDFCSCDAANGRAPVSVKINAPEGQIWTVKAVIGLYDAGSPLNTLIPLAVGTPLVYLGGNMFGLDALRRTDKGYWVQLTNGSTDKDLMVGNAGW
ncbi:MAG: hypothetical protein H6574_11585 [Lewinellaceae bacterium]|nr:hypothetical protein [Lewinellaceae bacterium]